MLKYIIKRLLAMIPVVIGITLLVFLIMQLAPGDAVRQILGDSATEEAIQAKKEELGLLDPLPVQYGRYMIRLVQGDMGTSYVNNRPVSDEVFSRLPATLKLALVSAVVSIILAIPLGILAAIKQNTLFDHASMVVSLIGISMPAFWLALMLMLLFSVNLGWFPVQGANDGWRSYVLPAIAIGFMNMAAIARTTRSSMLDCLNQDYIRTAKAKGVAHGDVINKHALKNALLPVITVVGMNVGSQMGGSVLTETVFSYPGLGVMLMNGIKQTDTPTILGCLVVMALCIGICNLLVDVLFAFIDPRIKSQYSKGR